MAMQASRAVMPQLAWLRASRLSSEVRGTADAGRAGERLRNRRAVSSKRILRVSGECGGLVECGVMESWSDAGSERIC